MDTSKKPAEAEANGKALTIMVNGRPKEVATKELFFRDVVALAFPNPPSNANTIFTVTYRRGHGNKPEGTLVDGESIKVKDGMIVNVTPTDKS